MPTLVLPASLPKHAVKEIEEDPSRLDRWLLWAAVGTAKDTRTEMFAMWAAAAEDYRECRAAAMAKLGRRLSRGDCGCGKCGPAALRARARVDRADDMVRQAIAEYKG